MMLDRTCVGQLVPGSSTYNYVEFCVEVILLAQNFGYEVPDGFFESLDSDDWDELADAEQLASEMCDEAISFLQDFCEPGLVLYENDGLFLAEAVE